ncbi:MAG TPA: serine/threonine-protein kinase [Planctomycetota bacterium]|nr:serine/threonine-protein kinase [Planctomycetota bacterium]
MFQEALELPEAERGAYLDQACRGQRTLRRRIDLLLTAHGEAGVFLANPTGGRRGAAPEEQSGQQIGRYKLQQVIGEGGFGTVWMAEQQEPVHRQVALKIIKRGMDSKMVVARFEAERQALALMDHPNIAKVFDGGETPSGLPFFVMELVRGVPITTYCDEQHLDSHERLELFVQVCHAVQHAHQKGIIHRDLKPSNVLVELHDVVPVVKVIDFGVAKATNRRLTDKTMFTEFRQMMGTPEYMSPEQAEVSGLDVDTRADVYSLGVLLYELLTGSTPFANVRERGVLEMLRIIREEEAEKPSTRISTLGERVAAVAKSRRVDARRLRRLVQGDLDWMVMKALEKDRARRYDTASAFAEDVRRFLAHEPVLAGPPGAGYRFRKYLRRHRVAVTAGGLVTLAVIGGAGAATWGLLDASEQRNRAVLAEEQAVARAGDAITAKELAVKETERANQERARAEAGEALAKQEALRANTVVRIVEDMLGAADPEQVKGKDYTVRQMLDAFDHGLGARLTSEPAVEASVRHLLGRAYLALGFAAKAEGHLERALEIDSVRAGEHSVEASRRMNDVAESMAAQGRFTEAAAMHRSALAILEQELGPDHADVAAQQINLAATLRDLGELDEAEALLQQALATGRRVAGEPSELVGKSLHNLAEVLRDLGRYPEAEKVNRQALEMLRAVLGEEHPTVAASLNNLALILHSMGKLAESERLHREALALTRKILGDEHPDVATDLGNLAAVLTAQGKYTDAEGLLRQSLAMRRRLLGEQHPAVALCLSNLAVVLNAEKKFAESEQANRDALTIDRAVLGNKHPMVAVCLCNLASVLLELGRLDEAEQFDREALEMQRELLGVEHPSVAASLNNLAAVLHAQGKHAEAEPLLRQAIEMRCRLLGEDHPAVAQSRASLATVLVAQGKLSDAEIVSRQALEVSRRRNTKDDPSLAAALEQLAQVLMQRQKHADAEPILRECLQIRAGCMPNEVITLHTMSLIGGAIAAQGRHEEADPLLRDAYDKMQPPPQSLACKQEALARLIKHYDDWGRPELAAAYRKQQQAPPNK